MRTAVFALLGTAALASGFGGAAASADDTAILREAKDRAEIEALMWKYVRALDSFDEESYASVFTEDGQFGVGQNAEKGRPALKKMIADLKKGRADREAAGQSKSPPMYHMITNHSIEFVDQDHARYHGYWLTVFGAAGENGMTRVAAAGQEVDDLVRVDGKWLIKLRNVAAQE
ncbi:MAG TPA: nuclear transport factor 2 family protein [Gammaproteobacteria bacterium]|nr:nuclear transport factor 2 family protein [Gammaproteobacteria bacterium]